MAAITPIITEKTIWLVGPSSLRTWIGRDSGGILS
jgi:hypothetical protein